jgi:lysophospholipase L1-like esterase
MSATNGSTRLRNRGRIVGLALACVLALSAVLASTAGAAPPPIKEKYLALGDSVAFGYSTQTFNENFPTESPSAFEKGYAHWYFLHLKPGKEGVAEINNGCPGETTDSMIGNGALAAAFGIEGESPCAYHKTGFPLHHEYGGEKSQLENVIETMAVNQFSGTPVTHISLNIGANDELHQIAKCEKEIKEEFEKEGKSKYGETPEKAFFGCIAASVPGLFKHIIENIGRIDTAIREGSKFGGVNYGGPIIFQAGYDPYGNICGPYWAQKGPVPAKPAPPLPEEVCRGAFKFKEKQQEYLEGSRALAALLTSEQKKNLAPFGMCFADPLPVFNPANSAEPYRIQLYTNMTNFSESNSKKNGPDIHPTELGYKKLNSIMVKACG